MYAGGRDHPTVLELNQGGSFEPIASFVGDWLKELEIKVKLLRLIFGDVAHVR